MNSMIAVKVPGGIRKFYTPNDALFVDVIQNIKGLLEADLGCPVPRLHIIASPILDEPEPCMHAASERSRQRVLDKLHHKVYLGTFAASTR